MILFQTRKIKLFICASIICTNHQNPDNPRFALPPFRGLGCLPPLPKIHCHKSKSNLFPLHVVMHFAKQYLHREKYSLLNSVNMLLPPNPLPARPPGPTNRSARLKWPSGQRSRHCRGASPPQAPVSAPRRRSLAGPPERRKKAEKLRARGG